MKKEKFKTLLSRMQKLETMGKFYNIFSFKNDTSLEDMKYYANQFESLGYMVDIEDNRDTPTSFIQDAFYMHVEKLK